MSSEEVFVKEALKFLVEIGVDTSQVEPETHLFDSGVLDSLATLAFLDFLEQQSGGEIEVETLDVGDIATLRNAYQFSLTLQP